MFFCKSDSTRLCIFACFFNHIIQYIKTMLHVIIVLISFRLLQKFHRKTQSYCHRTCGVLILRLITIKEYIVSLLCKWRILLTYNCNRHCSLFFCCFCSCNSLWCSSACRQGNYNTIFVKSLRWTKYKLFCSIHMTIYCC